MPRDDPATRESTEVSGELISMRVAEHGDVERIAAIAAEYDLSQLSDEASRSGGFLVSGFSKAEYHDFIDRADHFYVAQDLQGLVGFVLAYSSERIRSNEWLNKRLTVMHPDPFVLIKQICVTRQRTSREVGSALYRTVFTHAPGRNALTALVADPPNERSVTFHQRHGFCILTDVTPPDGLPREVWLRSPCDLETVREQYAVATELYRHEDTLNWSKLNNLFYVTGGLVAILGIAWEPSAEGNQSGFRALTVAVSIIGVVAATAFWLALYWGVRYMQERKDAVQDVEEKLLAAGGVPVVTRARAPEQKGHQFERSPTGIMLQVLPLLVAAGWVLVGVLAVTLPS